MSLISETKHKLESQAREAGLLDDGGGNDNGDSSTTSGSADSRKPQLKLPTDNRLIGTFAHECGEIIAKSGALFRRDLIAVIVNKEHKRLDTMTAQHFITWAEKFIGFFKERKVENETYRIPRSMNLATASAVLESHSFLLQLPAIKRLNPTRQPVIRDDGQCELLPVGYFAERAIYTLDDEINYDLEMTGDRASEILRDFFSEYPLDPRSRAAQIAAMLTPYCSGMVTDKSRPPCFIFTANAPRAGKSMLAKWPNITLYGYAATRTLPRYEEARKVLDIIALQGDTYAIFDNIRGKIQGEEIEAFLATFMWSVRPLGQSAEFKVENHAVVFFTGNQLDRSQDMADRGLFIELLVQEVDSRDRRFSRVINDAFVAAHRNEICSALWAMVREWDAAGRPEGERIMGGFETWSKIVPGIVKQAGFGDCLAKPHIKGQSDEIEDITELVKALLPQGEEAEAKYEFEALMRQVKELGLFESEEVRGGRRDVDLFDKEGTVTRAGRSLFGKLFIRYDRRKFLFDSQPFVFLVVGKGDSRRYHIARA